jgi:mRNA-degrading endonuclease toxin of MazEF toxin-antitoxin module
MAHQIRTISKKRLIDLVGYLEDAQLQHEVGEAIKEHLNLD